MNSEVLSISLTIVATIITLYNTILFFKQSKLMEKQTLIQRTEIYPLVRIRDVKVNGDVFKISLENMAQASAFQLGLLIHFIPCFPRGKHWQFFDEINWTDNNMQKGYPRKIVVPAKNKEGLSRLYGQEKDTFEAQALFLFGDSMKDPSRWKADKFEELRNRLMGQGIRFVAVMISLVYKDIPETIEESENVGAFVVDFQRHESFEEAWEEKIPFHDRTIGYEEISFMDYETYHRGKTYRGFLKPPE